MTRAFCVDGQRSCCVRHGRFHPDKQSNTFSGVNLKETSFVALWFCIFPGSAERHIVERIAVLLPFGFSDFGCTSLSALPGTCFGGSAMCTHGLSHMLFSSFVAVS